MEIVAALTALSPLLTVKGLLTLDEVRGTVEQVHSKTHAWASLQLAEAGALLDLVVTVPRRLINCPPALMG